MISENDFINIIKITADTLECEYEKVTSNIYKIKDNYFYYESIEMYTNIELLMEKLIETQKVQPQNLKVIPFYTGFNNLDLTSILGQEVKTIFEYNSTFDKTPSDFNLTGLTLLIKFTNVLKNSPPVLGGLYNAAEISRSLLALILNNGGAIQRIIPIKSLQFEDETDGTFIKELFNNVKEELKLIRK